MTITGCREICYGQHGTLYGYQYAALKNTECHCFTDFFATSKCIEWLWLLTCVLEGVPSQTDLHLCKLQRLYYSKENR